MPKDNDNTVPTMDHKNVSSQDGHTEAELLDAVLQSSDFTKDLYDEEPLPHEEVPEVDSVESDEIEDPEDSDETVTDEEYEEEDVEDDVEDDDESTQDTEVFTADDLDLDAKVRVKIDGEELDVTFSELLKGYQTDNSLSKKGRELGEAKKALEEERNQALQQIQELGQASTAVLLSEEQKLAKDYHNVEAEIKKAREDGDTYELSELKDKRELVQQKYWDARKQREGLQSRLQEQQTKQQEEQWNKQLEYFNESISELVPDFDADVAADIRDFAISEGVPEDVVDSIVDPVTVKILNDYRKLKQSVSKGQAKRKTVAVKKAVPVKKGRSKSKQKQDSANLTKARAFREDASDDDQMAFLKQYAENSLKY